MECKGLETLLSEMVEPCQHNEEHARSWIMVHSGFATLVQRPIRYIAMDDASHISTSSHPLGGPTRVANCDRYVF